MRSVELVLQLLRFNLPEIMKKGFTLIELLVVIAIIVILASSFYAGCVSR